VADRFRLIYLKSPVLEKSTLDESSSSQDSEDISRMAPSPSETRTPEISSSQTILNQAKADLKHPDPKVKILAIQYLEKCELSIALPLLQDILSDRDAGVRAQALNALIKLRNPVVPSLVKKYLKDKDPSVRVAALRAMFQMGEKIDLNILLQFLDDESPWVRQKVATLLGWTQMEGVLPILMKMSKDQDLKVRKAALFSLLTLYPEESEKQLVEAMTDRDPDLRKWVKDTLGKMAGKPLKRRMVSFPKRS
jgi:HEAT repeat protein